MEAHPSDRGWRGLVAAAVAVMLVPAGCCATGRGASGDDVVLLSDWMGNISSVIANQTLLDLSLPGTHDSMTSDLSTTFSDGGNDLPPAISWILHEFRDLAPGPFVRNQSKTQGLTMTQQLEAGMRFIDFRIMFSAPPNASASSQHDWYCLHMMQSRQRAMVYLTEARRFLDAHPGEVLVLWLSRHGSACLNGQGQYPDVTVAQKQAFWAQIESLFEGMLLDSQTQAPNTTTYAEMVRTGRRVVIYAADYAEFTGNSSRAIDSCHIDNQLGDDVADEPKTVASLVQEFGAANETKAKDKAQNRFYLKSLAAGPPDSQLEYAALIHFSPFGQKAAAAACAKAFHIPGMDDWCPMTLQQASQLGNYYNQIALDAVITKSLHLPNAIYINAVDVGGLIRTGTAWFDGPHDGDDPHATTGFAYADTFVLYNVRRVCDEAPHVSCQRLLSLLQRRRAQHPLLTWSDPAHGRLVGWPNASSNA